MSTALPDNVAEVASVHISVGMGEDGTGCAYEYDGLSPEAAIGYLTTVVDQLRQEVRDRWDSVRDDGLAFHINLECPECGEEIDITSSPDFEDDDDAGEVE